MQKLIRMAVVACLLSGLHRAYAVPSFARQTGLSCNVCHSNPPELTAFGRNFKLRGYVLTDMTAKDKVGNAKDLLLSKYIPISVMVLLSNTSYQANQPAAQNNSAGFPQQLSIFLAGGFASHFGGLAQVTYTHADDHFGMDNTDLRYANQGKLGGKDWEYGITLNNNPTVEDVWNSTPAWGFPWISTASGVGPIASSHHQRRVSAQDVAGVGGYSMWNNHLYTDVTVYRSEHAGASTPVTGTGQSYNISGVAPYWRAAWQQTWGSNYLEVGTYGIYVNSFPGAVSGPEDSLCGSVDSTSSTSGPSAPTCWTFMAPTSTRNRILDATYAAGGARTPIQPPEHVSSWTARTTGASKYSATGALFSTTGNSDALLYAPAALTGSNNGNPDTSGYIAQFGYWPVQNIDIDVNYSGYFKFNGASTNYDGAHAECIRQQHCVPGLVAEFLGDGVEQQIEETEQRLERKMSSSSTGAPSSGH